MVVSLKANRKRILAVFVLIVVVVGGFLVIPKLVTAPMKHYGETASQRVEFLKSFGYDVAQEPVDARKVTIPREFNEVYTKYNTMQKAQGFDLKPYRGRECWQYVYLVNNYPNSTKEIHATLLVYEGVIIGGDVSCAEIDGFMHGFALDSARYGEDVSAKSEASESGTSEESAPAPEGTGENAQVQQDDAAQKDASAGEEQPAESASEDISEDPAEETAGEPEEELQETGAEAEAEEIYPTD